MAFTDDLRGLPRAEQIARIQAAARAAGDELDQSQASQALGLYTATVASGEADAGRGAADADVDAQYAYFPGWRPDLPAAQEMAPAPDREAEAG